MRYSPSGEFAITCGARSPVRLCRAEDWRLIRQIDDARSVFHACFSPNGRRIATANSAMNAVRLWDATTGRNICSLPGDIDLAEETRFSRDGSIIAQSGSFLRGVSVWWAPSWEDIARQETGFK
jgi:WD40 repeat protein